MATSKKQPATPFHIRYLATWLGLGLLRLLCFLPYSMVIYVGLGLGKLVNRFFKSRRRVAEINLKLCMPQLSDKDREQLLNDTMIANGIGVIETFYSWWGSNKQLMPRYKMINKELIEQYTQQGRGVILLGAHYTTLGIGGRGAASHLALDAMYQTQSNDAVDYCLKRARLRHFNNMLEKHEMRRLLKLLKQGNAIWYACDQDFGRKNSVFAPFFGVQAATIATLGRLIKMTNAKVLMCHQYRISDGSLADSHYEVTFFDPFTDEPLGDDDQRNAELINIALEKAIMLHPEQYFWVHRRFKRRPGEEKSPYK